MLVFCERVEAGALREKRKKQTQPTYYTESNRALTVELGLACDSGVLQKFVPH